MALFQEQETEHVETFQPQNKIYQTYKNELDSIYSNKQNIIQQRQENESQFTQKLISPEKIKEWKDKGSMTAIEVFNRKNADELVPFMGTWKEGTKSFKLKEISDKIRNGQFITPEERDTYNNFVLDMAEIQTRGFTFGGGAMNIGLETIPFMAEFGIGLLTSGGTASVGATSSKLSTEVLKKSLKKQIAEGVKKTVYNATINPRTYAFTATRLPQQVRARMGDIMLSESVAVTPEGQVILKESQTNPALAFMKALALTNIETASEMSGAMLVRPVMKAGGKLGKVISTPILKMLPEGFADKFVKLAEQVTKLPFAKAVDDLGFNGILEEMGEERVGDLLQFAFNLDGEEGYTFEQLLDSMFPNISEGFGEFAKTLGQEALSFGATGLGMNALDKGIKSLPKAGEKYTKDGFLIDTGIFRVAGYDSYLDSKVKEELQNRGKTEEEIDNAINFSTRDDKVQFLKETNTQFDTKKEYDEKEQEKELKRVEVEDKAYQKLMQGGLDQDVAFANAKLFGQFFKKYGSGNIKAFDEWFDKFDVQYNIPAKNGNVLHQFIGEKGAENLDTGLLKDLEKAKELVRNGALDHKVLQETGWFKGADNNWRYEISDKEAEIITDRAKYNAPDSRYSYENYQKELYSYNSDLNKYVQQKENGDLTQEEFNELYSLTLDLRSELERNYNNEQNRIRNNFVHLEDILKHDTLYKAYPKLRRLLVEFVPTNQNFGGRFIGNELVDSIEIPEATLKSDNFKSILMHEIQHYIQDKEDFAQGGNPDSVEQVVRHVLNKINNSDKERERKQLVKQLDDLYKENFVLGSALQVLRVHEKQENMFKTWWWSKHGSWYIPRKTRKKEYKSFMSEWTDKYLQGVHKEIEEKGEVDKYHEYLKKDINELRKLYRNLQAKIDRLWKKLPKDIAHNFRNAVIDLEKTHTGFEEEQLRKELYRRLAGEVEARNTQARLDMSEEERRKSHPRFTQDYENQHQLIVFSDGSTVSYSPSLSDDEYNYFQSANEFSETVRKNIQDKFGLSIEELTDLVKADIENILEDNNIESEDFDIKRIRLYGSYSTGKNRKSSDLDFLVEYEGSMREDDAFNMFADSKLKIEDKNGKKIKVDINPTRADKSGTIEDHLENSEGFIKTYFQSAYHGTPHRFDKFSTEHIGSGEGNQAHGWGLYFAEDKKVSEGYFKRLSDDKVFYDGQELEKTYIYTHKIERGIDKETNRYLQDLRYIIDRISEIKSDENISLEEAKIKFIKNYEQKGKLLAFQRKILDIAKNLDVEKIELQKGQLYEVDIPDSDVLLDEDKPLNEQPDKVKKAILEYYKSRPNDYIIPEDINSLSQQRGKEFYRDVAFQLERENSLAYRMANGLNTDIDENFNPEKEASLLLNSLGIKGITYDGRQDGRCYVIFDDKAIDVLKTYYQEAGEPEEEKLIAGYTYPEVLDKLTELYEKLGADENKLSEQEKDSLMAKIHVLEDSFEVAENPEKFSNEDRRNDIMLNAYYIMNNQEIPEDYVDTDKKSARTYNDYVKMHREKKEKKEAEYYGYFTEGHNKNIITIMENHDSSTALHELGHLFLNGLNELARVDKNAQKQLEAVNKWLGFSGEYTVAQQEKFARSFEAYLYKGKAPNNTLRQVFENFKEWLKSVYDDITNLENKGADISDEVQEMFDNMFGSDEYYQERKQANELLKQVKNIVRKQKLEKLPERDNTELDEKSKRYKDVSYEILSVGTGKSVKYLKTIFETTSNRKSFGKKREAIQELLDSVDDKITVSGGMRHHWYEFYGDTGVTYNNDEIDGDYRLVEQALDVIINKAYDIKNIENELDERAAYFEKAIDEADRQYKVLLSNYKTGNRNVVLSAMYEWLESLNDEIKQDYEDRFIYDSGVIERNENVDKFDRAKRQILSKALELNTSMHTSINDNQKYQETVKQIMRSLDFLQPSDKAKLTANILDVPSVSWLMSSLDNIMDIAKTMEDVNLRRNLEREIHKELQGTKNVKKNGRTVGKYDYKTNKLFEELRELDRLSPEKANELRLEVSKFSTAEDNGLSFKDKLVNKFLSYKAGGRTFADTELMKELYDEIVKIKLAGKSAKSELDLMEKLDETKDIEELINIVQGKKQAGNLIKNYIDKVANLESTLNAIFNKDIKERYGAEILYAETQAQAWQHQQKQNFEREVANIYNLPEWCWDKKILEYLSEKHVYPEIRRKYDTNGDLLKTRSVDRTLTKMDIIQAYIWSKNEILEKRLINQFGQETLDSMFDELSLEDVKFAELMQHTAQSFYPLVNKAFINKYGLDLPKVSCYFPSTPERGSEVDLYNDYSSKSLNNGFTKARAMSETQAMDFHNPVATLYNHIEGVSKFVFMSDSLDRANLRFKDLDLKRVIINKYGEDVYRTLEQALMNVTYKKEAPVFNGMNKIIDNMVGNWIQANVAVKPIVGLKQLLSANNYAVDMPYMTWQAGFLKALAHPKETIDYMMNIPYIKARFEGNFSNEFLKSQIENSAFAMSKKLKDACTLFVKIGDIGAIMFGGKPYIEYLIKEKGMSEEQAIKQFILSTNRSQQSSAISSLSNFQVNMTRNPMGKLFIAFKNSPQQYIRMCGDSIVSVANGDMSKTQCAKMLFQYGYLQPFFYAVATSGSLLRFLFTGDDDDLTKDATISIFNFGSDALPIIGDIYKYALNRMAYKEKFLPQTTPLLGDIQSEINKISKDDVSLSDYLEAIGYLGLHVGLGYNSKAFTSIGSGFGDIANDKVEQGAMKVLGYTEKRAKHITGNEDKKK